MAIQIGDTVHFQQPLCQCTGGGFQRRTGMVVKFVRTPSITLVQVHVEGIGLLMGDLATTIHATPLTH